MIKFRVQNLAKTQCNRLSHGIRFSDAEINYSSSNLVAYDLYTGSLDSD
jgi:hypothetical protein